MDDSEVVAVFTIMNIVQLQKVDIKSNSHVPFKNNTSIKCFYHFNKNILMEKSG